MAALDSSEQGDSLFLCLPSPQAEHSTFLLFAYISIVGSSLLIVVACPPELKSCDTKSDFAVFSGVELHS